ncbi:MAG: hypothetical protein HY713_07485 [candidate division NC10 bacterium]|nr:hypothetical protein [candidate division NC10 bacterium]
MSSASRIARVLAGIERRPMLGLVALAVLAATQINPWWRAGPDSAAYLSIARSLASGEGLARFGSPNSFYAPGYSVLVAPLFWISVRPFLAISTMNWVTTLLLAIGVYRWIRRLLPDQAVLVAGLVMVNVAVLEARLSTLSELTFMTLLFWSAEPLALAVYGSGRRLWAAGALATVIVAILTAVRYPGALLLASLWILLVGLAVRRSISWVRAAALVVGVSLPVIALATAMIAHDQAMAEKAGNPRLTYTRYFRRAAESASHQMLEGLRLRISEVGRLIVPGMYKSYARKGQWLNINMLIYLPAFTAVLLGWWRMVRFRMDPVLWLFPFYLGLYIVWPYDQATRYMMPLLPLLWMCVLTVLRAWRRVRKGLPGVVAGLLAAHFVVATVYWVPWLRDARAQDANWVVVDEFAAVVGPKEPSGAFVGNPGPMQWMFALAVDRLWPAYDAIERVPPGGRWVIVSALTPPLPGYVVRREVGQFRLLERMFPVRPSSPDQASDFGGYQEVLAVHAEGSIEAEKLAIYRSYDSKSAYDYAKWVVGITD